MKRVLFASVLLLLSVLPLSRVTEASVDEPAAYGSFQVSLENGLWRHIQFEARLATDGQTTGEIAFHDAPSIPTGVAPATNENVNEAQASFYAKATCDCLLINGVEAVLGGTVTESSHRNFIGRRVLLAVQDGDNFTPRLRDKLTFGFYTTPSKKWVATDAERPEEDGFVPAWVATDAERTDDPGTLSYKSDETTCTSFPLSSHSFIGAKQGKGKVHVTH
jgi:hypothetical protein